MQGPYIGLMQLLLILMSPYVSFISPHPYRDYHVLGVDKRMSGRHHLEGHGCRADCINFLTVIAHGFWFRCSCGS